MSIGYLSMNGINGVLGQFAQYDPNIESYGFGQLYNQDGVPKASQKYPGMWVNPVQTTYTSYSLERRFQIIIYDLVFDNEGGTNQNKLVSDCEEIAFRLVRFLRSKSDTFEVITDPVVQPFSDKFLDDVSGVIIDIVITSNAESSECNDPLYNFTIKENNID